MNKISFFLLVALFFNFTFQAAEVAAQKYKVLFMDDEFLETLKKNPNFSIKNFFEVALFGYSDKFVLPVFSVSVLYEDQISQVMQWVNQGLSDFLIKPQAQHELKSDNLEIKWETSGCVRVKIDRFQGDWDNFLCTKIPTLIDDCLKEEIDQAARKAAKNDQKRENATAILQASEYSPDLAKSIRFFHSPTGPFRPFVQHPAIKN